MYTKPMWSPSVAASGGREAFRVRESAVAVGVDGRLDGCQVAGDRDLPADDREGRLGRGDLGVGEDRDVRAVVGLDRAGDAGLGQRGVEPRARQVGILDRDERERPGVARHRSGSSTSMSSGSGPTANASSPSNHGLMSVVNDLLALGGLETSSSRTSSSLVSRSAWSAKPGKWLRNSPTLWRWSPGRSRRTSPYMTLSAGT